MSKSAIGVVGFGRTGLSLLDFLLTEKIHSKIILYNDGPIEDVNKKREYISKGVTFFEGEKDFGKLNQLETVIVSPGVNGRQERFYQLRQEGVKIISEVEFAYQFILCPIIAVTGTNGKSTTVSLIHHFLLHSGFKSVLTGNIGVPLISFISQLTKDNIVVVELSSFQLEEIIDFRPHIAVILNITPDHLDRYQDMPHYIQAKCKIFQNQADGDFLILNRDDPVLAELHGGLGQKVWFSRQSAFPSINAWIENNTICFNQLGRVTTVSLEKNPLIGIHHLENLLAAVPAALLAGAKASSVEKSLPHFKGLPHRMVKVETINGIEFVNDSKATNVDATLKSILSLTGEAVLILGGKDKGGDFRALQSAIEKKVKKVLLLGKAADTISQQLHEIKDRLIKVNDMFEAVKKGYELFAGSAGVVLLAPACASFDQFKNFEHRGEVFCQAVRELKERIEKKW